MFENIGAKLKGLAIFMCWIGIIASVIGAIVLWSQNTYRNPTVALGLGVLIVGCFGSWVGSFFTYAIGVIAESSEQHSLAIEQLIKEQKKTNEHLLMLQQTKATGSITKEADTPKNVSEYLPEL